MKFLDVQVSLDYQFKKIEKKYGKDGLLNCTTPAEALSRSYAYYMRSKDDHSYLAFAPLYYIMVKKRFDIAWVFVYYNPEPPKNQHIFAENELSWNVEKYWDHLKAQIPIDPETRWQQIKEAEKKGELAPLLLGDNFFRPDDLEKNDQLLYERARLPNNSGAYDYRPETRYDRVEDTALFAMRHGGLYNALLLFALAFRQERHEIAAECLFRMQNAIAIGEAPKYMMEYPRLKMLAPVVNFYAEWFNARYASDEAQRKNSAWTAIYWLIEHLLNTSGTSHTSFESISTVCQVIGEFELMGDQQAEFLRHFKRTAQFASISFCRKMIDDPTPMISFPERGLPTFAEFKKMVEAGTI